MPHWSPKTPIRDPWWTWKDIVKVLFLLLTGEFLCYVLIFFCINYSCHGPCRKSLMLLHREGMICSSVSSSRHLAGLHSVNVHVLTGSAYVIIFDVFSKVTSACDRQQGTSRGSSSDCGAIIKFSSKLQKELGLLFTWLPTFKAAHSLYLTFTATIMLCSWIEEHHWEHRPFGWISVWIMTSCWTS